MQPAVVNVSLHLVFRIIVAHPIDHILHSVFLKGGCGSEASVLTRGLCREAQVFSAWACEKACRRGPHIDGAEKSEANADVTLVCINSHDQQGN